MEVAQARQCRSGWNQGELDRRQLGLLTLTAHLSLQLSLTVEFKCLFIENRHNIVKFAVGNTQMKKYLIFVLSLGLIGCSHAEWVKTTDGSYLYGKYPSNKDIVWQGAVNGPLVNGPGTIIVLDKDGAEKFREDVETHNGAVSSYNYIPLSDGVYLGGRKNDLPKGFGSLIRNDTLFLGNFKKGKLHSGKSEIYTWSNTDAQPCFIGMFSKGVPNGPGAVYENGQLVYTGGFKKGLKSGLGKEYSGASLLYDGSFKKGKRSGYGKEYKEGILVYDGNWDDDLRNGQGTAYNERGILWYSGSWKHGLYNGKGKLYENGKCTEGKWDEGRLTKSISTSVFNEIGSATKMWLSDLDSLDLSSTNKVYVEQELPSSQLEFIEQLNDEIENSLSAHFDKRVDKRFGFWHLPRMLFQPWFKSDIQRANSAQKYFCKGFESTEMETLINSRIDYYNENSLGEKLSYIKLDKLPDGEIVDTDTAMKIFEREAMETTDVLAGVLVDVIVCLVIAFIIGLIIGLFFPGALPYAGLVDIIMTVIAFLIAMYLSIFRTTAVSIELESVIKQMLVDNYIQFLDAQNIIMQIIGMS
mgnify:FL=1